MFGDFFNAVKKNALSFTVQNILWKRYNLNANPDRVNNVTFKWGELYNAQELAVLYLAGYYDDNQENAELRARGAALISQIKHHVSIAMSAYESCECGMLDKKPLDDLCKVAIEKYGIMG